MTLLSKARLFTKMTIAGSALAAYFVGGYLGLALSKINRYWAIRLVMTPNIRWTCFIVTKIIGVRLVFHNVQALRSLPKGSLVVANHVSYLDMILLHRLVSGCFITSNEVKRDAAFGQFAKTSGCIFVDRESRDRQAHEKSEVTDYLKHGINVLMFPEGWASDGTMTRFRRPFFEPATILERSILAVTINFRAIDGKPLTPDSKDVVYWYRQMPLLPHVRRLLSHRRVDIDFYFQQITPAMYLDSDQHPADFCHVRVAEHYITVS